MKNKLVEIITNTQANCVGKDCNKCSYYGQEHCLINRVADALLEMYERLQKENERLYEIKLDLENQLIQSGLTEYIGADEIKKTAIEEFYEKINENTCVFTTDITKSNDYQEGYIQALADFVERIDQVKKQYDIDLEV